jgi:hypothetical protein
MRTMAAGIPSATMRGGNVTCHAGSREDMPEAKASATSRYIVFVVVLAFHLALLGLILAESQTRNVIPSPERPIEITFLPPNKVREVRIEHTRPKPMSTNVSIALAPPLFNSSSERGSSSAPAGHGSTVNWTAEAHRAIRAFEIRRDQPQNSDMSPLSRWDEWWTHEHHAGDQGKTPDGDWIVWIDANCYQVASWHSNASALSAGPGQTVCQPESNAPQGD